MNGKPVEIRVAEMNDGIAGRTKDSTLEKMTVYMDPLVPEAMYRSIVVHEYTELRDMLKGDSYQTAHRNATKNEKTCAERHGADWAAYNRNYIKLLRRVERRGGTNPADLFEGEQGERPVEKVTRDENGRCHDDNGYLTSCGSGGGSGKTESKPSSNVNVKVKGKDSTYTSPDSTARIQAGPGSKGHRVVFGIKLSASTKTNKEVVERLLQDGPTAFTALAASDPKLAAVLAKLRTEGKIKVDVADDGSKILSLRDDSKPGATKPESKPEAPKPEASSESKPPKDAITYPEPKPFSGTFKPAKTAKDAETFATTYILNPAYVKRINEWNQGPNHKQEKLISYRGVAPNLANGVNQRLLEYSQTSLPVPRLSRILSRPMKEDTKWAARMDSSGILELNSRLLGSNEKMQREADAGNKLYGGEGVKLLKILEANEASMDKKDKAQLNQLRTFMKYKRSNVGATDTPEKQLQAVVDHEFAHHVARHYGNGDKKLLEAFKNDMNSMIVKVQSSDYKYKLSYYAGESTSPEETYAEGFAAYRRKEYDDLHPDALKFYKKYFPGL